MSDDSNTLIRVLLVEDNPGDARLLREALADVNPAHFELTHATTLSEGMERLAADRIDVVLLDLSLPDANGLDTFVRLHARAPNVPIVVLTGLADETVAAAALREGAQDYLVKGQVDSNLLSRSMRYAIERMRTEESLRESEGKYRALFEDSRDAILVSDAQGIVIDANQAALDLFGFAREQALGSDVGDRYLHDADRKRFREELSDLGAVRDFEVALKKWNGTVMECLLTATRRRDEQGNNLGIQGLVRDITGRKRAEEALLQQTRDLAVLQERNRMAREIHDTLAQGFTGIVVQLEAGEQVMEESPEELKGHISRARELARNSLQEARRSVWGLLPRSLEGQSLESALKEEVDQFASAGPGSTSFKVVGQRRDLPTDVQAALFRICQESLTNIRRHAQAQQVFVDLSFDRDCVRLGIRDDGGGFARSAARSSDGQGGFGLSGMEQRAAILGGTLEITSPEGEGTRVEVSIPTS